MLEKFSGKKTPLWKAPMRSKIKGIERRGSENYAIDSRYEEPAMPRMRNPRRSRVFGTAKILRDQFAQKESEIEWKAPHVLVVAIPHTVWTLASAAHARNTEINKVTSSNLRRVTIAENSKWSGWPDLNRRPLAPQASALPVCATPRREEDYISAPAKTTPYEQARTNQTFFFGATRGRHCTNARMSTWNVHALFD
jgi:hypothetical protein